LGRETVDHGINPGTCDFAGERLEVHESPCCVSAVAGLDLQKLSTKWRGKESSALFRMVGPCLEDEAEKCVRYCSKSSVDGWPKAKGTFKIL